MTTSVGEHIAELVVLARADAADDIISLVLGAPDGAELPAWTPGAHVDLVLPGSVTRQYSLSGSPADRHTWRIGVLLDRAGRGGSRQVHDGLHPGSTIPVRGPRNHFPLVTAQRHLFLAGGIGITPLLPMVAALGDADWTMHYGGRRRASMAFTEELAAYGDRVQLWPEDERGMLDLAALLDQPQPGTALYTCGPEGLLAAVEARCAGWPPGSLHLERFAARPADPAAVAAPSDVEVVCQRSGITVLVPGGRSILEVVQEAGVGVLSSCLEGVCGTCETAVLEGVPDHRDSLLSADERAAGDYMMICVSRATTSRLVLDL